MRAFKENIDRPLAAILTLDTIAHTVVATSDEEFRNAHHAYYANTSFVDSKVGEIDMALTWSDLIDDTVIIITPDHGDMLGESGTKTMEPLQ